jgi:hypothetical protein
MTENEWADGGGVEADKRSEGDSKTRNKGNETMEILSLERQTTKLVRRGAPPHQLKGQYPAK